MPIDLFMYVLYISSLKLDQSHSSMFSYLRGLRFGVIHAPCILKVYLVDINLVLYYLIFSRGKVGQFDPRH